MDRPTLFCRLVLVIVILVSSLHLTVNGVHAQPPLAASADAPAAEGSAPSEPVPAATVPVAPWQPKRFARLYQPRPQSQARDLERPVDLGVRPEPRRHTGLLIGGVMMWMTSYLVTALAAGVVSAVNASDCEAGDIVRACNDGSLMLIPLAGPFLTSRVESGHLLLGIPQLLGAALLIAGIFHYASRPIHDHSRALPGASFALSPMPLRDGALLAARVTF